MRGLVSLILTGFALLASIPNAEAGFLFRNRLGCRTAYVAPCYAPAVYAAPVIAPAYVAPLPAVQVNVNNVPAYTPSWRSEVIAAYVARDDRQAYLDAIGPLSGSYGLAYGQRSIQLGSYGASGNTIYNYSALKGYNEVDLNVLFQQSSRLVAGAQQLAGQANTQFGERVGQITDAQARLLEIQTRAQAAKLVLDATAPQPRSTATVIERGGAVIPGSIVPPNPTPQNNDQADIQEAANFLKITAMPLCAGCHSSANGAKPQGGFDVLSYPTMTAEQKEKVWARIMSTDPEKRMPRKVDEKGVFSPGPPLTAQQKQAFFTH